MDESVAARIPQEMVDAIVGQLYANKDWCALGSFSLVQNPGIPQAGSASRRYLFDTIPLGSSNVDGFLKMSIVPRCVVASYVRRRRLKLTQLFDNLLNCNQLLSLGTIAPTFAKVSHGAE